MKSTAYLLLVMYFVLAPTNANAKPEKWVAIQKMTNEFAHKKFSIKAILLEDSTAPLLRDEYIGNINVSRNNRPRKLNVEVTSHGRTSKIKTWSFMLPSKTIGEDECTVNELSDLAMNGEHLSVSLSYQVACGAGSGVNVTHILSVSKNFMRLEELQMESASRDRLQIIHIDFSSGKAKIQDEQPEEITSSPPNISSFRPYHVPIDPLTLIRCPYPLHGKAMPNCAIAPRIDTADSPILQKSTAK